MSAEDGEQDVTGEAPAEASEPAAKKPAAKKRAAAKKPAAEKAAAEKAAAEKPTAEEEPETDVESKPAAKKRAPKRAAKKTAAEEPAAAVDEPAAEQAREPAAGKPAEKAVAPKPQAKPRSGSRGGGRAPRRRVVRARARYVRTSARKARMVSGHLQGKTVGEARAILAFTSREVARDWSKLLESAVANAENNHELLEEDLVVREAYADEGPTIKRFRPRAMGRATPIHKRTSHLTITLTPGS